MNILNSNKCFKDIQVGEKIYILNPHDGKILELTVLESRMHPKSKQRSAWVIQTYLPFTLDSIKDEALKTAEEFGTPVRQTWHVPCNDAMCLTQSKVPTIIATEHKYIEEWMTRKGSGLTLAKKN